MAWLEDQIDQFFKEYENGLGVLEVPTGIGKTHATVAAVVRYIQRHGKKGKHIFFVTPQRKNLPENDFLDAFARAGMDGNRYCLRLPSYLDAVLKTLPQIEREGKLPDKVRNARVFQDLSLAVHRHQEENARLRTEKTERNQEVVRHFLKDIEDQIREKQEPAFRRWAKRQLFHGVANQEDRQQKIQKRLKRNFSWIPELYPSAKLWQYPVTLMSAKRFLYPVDPFDGPAYPLFRVMNEHESIVIFDEFDDVWNDMEEMIVEEAWKLRKDALQLFHELSAGLHTEFSVNLQEADKRIRSRRMHLKEMQEEEEAISRRYHATLSYRTDADVPQTDRGFLFCGYTTQTILQEQKWVHLLGRKDEQKHRMTVHFLERGMYRAGKQEGDIYISSMLEQLQRFFRSFGRYVRLLAKEYEALQSGQSPEAAIGTVFSKLQVSEPSRNLLLGLGNLGALFRDRKTPRDESYYQQGFCLFELENSEAHAEETHFLYMRRDATPEKLLCDLARNSLVLGLSATSFYQTSRTFDLAYCEDVLGELFLPLQEQLREPLKKEERRLQMVYDAHGIKIQAQMLDGERALGNAGRDLEELLETQCRCSKDDARILANSIREYAQGKDGVDEYRVARYLEMIFPLFDFCRSRYARAWLFLNQNLLRTDSEIFNRRVIAQACEIAAKQLPTGWEPPDIVILRSQTYEAGFQALQEKLRQGKRVLVFSSYATLSMGQNLQYEAPEGRQAVCIFPDGNPEDGRLRRTDFDGIVLGDITHLAWSVAAQDLDGMEESLHRAMMEGVSEAMKLMEMDAIDMTSCKKSIRYLLTELAKPSFLDSEKRVSLLREKNLPVDRRLAMRQAIQALGRISRTYCKQRRISIYVSHRVLENFDREELSHGGHALTPEQRCVAELLEQHTTSDVETMQTSQPAERCAVRRSILSARAIGQFLGRTLDFHWREGWMEAWEKLREFALSFPTFDTFPAGWDVGMLSRHYFEKEDRMPAYLYAQQGDFREIAISFSMDRVAFRKRAEISGERLGIIHEMSERDARLQILLKIPEVRDYFARHGYAASFSEGLHVMSPVFFNNIYKGALGEAVGWCILESFDVPVKPIVDAEIFEFFDFQLPGGAFIDFKHWRYETPESEEELYEKIDRKLQQAGGTRAYIVNMIDKPGARIHTARDGRIVVVPGLVDEEGKLIMERLHVWEELRHGDPDESRDSNL